MNACAWPIFQIKPPICPESARSIIYPAERTDPLALRYVLITSRSNHWDRVGNISSYPFQMLRGAVMNPERLADHTPAIFVKVDREMRTTEKCWEGEVIKITRRTDKVWLQFRLAGVTACPENFAGSPDGWYTDGTT